MKVNFYRSLLVAVVCSAALFACNTQIKQENAALKAQVDSLQQITQQLSENKTEMIASISYYENSLAQIDETLAKIAANQQQLNLQKGEINSKETTVEAIQERIASLKQMMEEARTKIITLDRNLLQLRKQNGAKSEEILALDQQLKAATQSLVDKEAEMIALQATLEAEIADLGQALKEQISVSTDLQNTLNRVFYYVGESKDLQEKGIVNKEGGFIGLGKVKMVNANADASLFKQGSKLTLEAIELNQRQATLISNHPDGSYEFIGTDKVERLKIVDKQAFWKDSNYLVIEVK